MTPVADRHGALAAGSLRHRVTLQSAADTPDGAGGFATVWSNVATLWAAIEPLAGRERLAAQQLESPLTHRVTLRHRDGVTTAMRVKFGVRVFNIRSVVNRAERDRALELLCEEGVAT